MFNPFGPRGQSGLDVGGISCDEGFALIITVVNPAAQKVNHYFVTPGYQRRSDELCGRIRELDLPLRLLRGLLTIALGGILLGIVTYPRNGYLVQFFFLLGAMLTARFVAGELISILAFRVTGNRTPQRQQWHWCEHAIAYLLENGQQPTIRALAQASVTLARCGTVQWWSTQLTAMTLGMMLMGVPRAGWFLASAVCAQLWFNARRLLPLAIAGLPVIAVGLLMERLFHLRRPTPLQMRQSVRILRAFLRAHPDIASRLTPSS